jgi:hypothetical protein
MVIACLLTALFAGALGRPGPWEGWWWFFLVVLLGGWVAAQWARPIGPSVWGVTWLPIFWMALLIALLLAAATPPRPRAADPPVSAEEATAAAAVGVFLWILLLGLLIAVVVGYIV